jgi:hypothetical protein
MKCSTQATYLTVTDMLMFLIKGTFNTKTNFSLYLIFFLHFTSVDTEMCCPKGKCGCQYIILLT